jgi:hypothetical protein
MRGFGILFRTPTLQTQYGWICIFSDRIQFVTQNDPNSLADTSNRYSRIHKFTMITKENPRRNVMTPSARGDINAYVCRTKSYVPSTTGTSYCHTSSVLLIKKNRTHVHTIISEIHPNYNVPRNQVPGFVLYCCSYSK